LEFGEGDLEAHRVSHWQRIEKCLGGDTPDRIPIAFWRHFPVDDQTPDRLARAVLDYQSTYDFDLVKVTPSSSYCLLDWGVEDVWRGNPEGTREYVRRVIQSPDDWLRLSVLDPFKGVLGDQLTCLKLVRGELGHSVPVLQTIFNPLAQAKNLLGGEKLLVHLRRFPDAVHEGLKTIVESTRRFIEAASKTGIAGIFYAVQHASYRLLSEEEYKEFGQKYDLQVLEAIDKLWVNMLHLHGEDVMFPMFIDYPIQVINWHDRETFPGLAEARAVYSGVLCGGLQRERTMVLGTPEQVCAEANDAILAAQGKRFILGTGCVLPVTTPRANIIAARRSCEV
jgi:uroporphyrinogen decarboxylase